MVAVKLSAFGGMLPSRDDRLLPENNAAYAQNTFLNYGSLQGFNQLKSLYTMVNPASKYAFRFPLISPDKNHIQSSFWLEFEDPDTNVLQSQVSNDAFDRFYFASPSQVPQYNTKTRILAGSSAYTLGIPTPETAPTLSSSGGSGTSEIRAYVYTWQSAFGEEGPPSPPTIQAGLNDATWTIGVTAPGSGDTTDRDLAFVNIYRTITDSTGNAVFYLVATIAIGTTSFTDTVSDLTLSGNTILPSVTYTPPPSDLQGIVAMPNGMMVGWRANELWFCEPFLPHAWPAAYTTSFNNNIVGLGVVGQTVVVLTEGFPWAGTGVSPSNMSFSMIATMEPCMSRASILSTATGVLYASPNGVVLAAYGIVQNASAQIATKADWQKLIRPETIRAARIQASYYAWGMVGEGCFYDGAFDNASFELNDFTDAYSGVFVDLIDLRIAWTELSTKMPMDNVMTDIWSGEILLVQNGAVLWLDTTDNTIPGPYLWRSKVLQLPQQRNLAAMRIWFDPTVGDPNFVLNPVRNVSAPQTLQDDQYGIVRVYAGVTGANKTGNLVMTRELRYPGEIMRLPAGFKKEFWQVEIEARVTVFTIEMGASVKELAAV